MREAPDTNVLVLSDLGFGSGVGSGVSSRLSAELCERAGIRSVKAGIMGEGSSVKLIVSRRIVKCFYDPLLAESLESLKETFGVDLIHANIINSPYAYTVSKMARKLELPLVLTVHTWLYLCPIEFNVMLPELIPCKRLALDAHCVTCSISKAKLVSTSAKGALLNVARMPYNISAYRSLLRKANCIISPSKIFSTELYRRMGIEAQFVPNSVDPDLLKEKVETEGDSSIVFLGRLEWEKGVQLLPDLAKSLSYVTVHIAGRGRLKEWLLKHKPENVVYHGFISEEKKTKLIRKASVIVVPSIWCEMFGYVVSEAFALGKPVVAFNLGGPKEQIEMSGGGLLAKPFDLKDFAEKVSYLVQNPSEAKKMGLRGRKWVEENLHPSKYGKALAKVYYDAINEM